MARRWAEDSRETADICRNMFAILFALVLFVVGWFTIDRWLAGYDFDARRTIWLIVFLVAGAAFIGIVAAIRMWLEPSDGSRPHWLIQHALTPACILLGGYGVMYALGERWTLLQFIIWIAIPVLTVTLRQKLRLRR